MTPPFVIRDRQRGWSIEVEVDHFDGGGRPFHCGLLEVEEPLSSPNNLLQSWLQVIEPIASVRRIVIAEGQLLRQQRAVVLHRLE